jgi:hypothetical protein
MQNRRKLLNLAPRYVDHVHRTVKFGTEVIVHIPWPVTFDAVVDHKRT